MDHRSEDIAMTLSGEFSMDMELSEEGRDFLLGMAGLSAESIPFLEITVEWSERRPGWRGWIDWLRRRKPIQRRIVVPAAALE